MRKILNILIITIIIVTFIIFDVISSDNKESVREESKLLNCIDGDTAYMMYKNEKIKVRFLAINTKEIGENEEEYGREASEYTCSKLKNARKIELEFDDKSDRYDKYGRLLAWVYVDEALLQLDLVSNGYAEIKYVYGTYKYMDELYDAENQAKEKKLLIWSE